MVDPVPVSQMPLASLISGVLLNIWKVWKEGRLQMTEYIFADFLGVCGVLERGSSLLTESLKAATFHVSISLFLWCEESWRDDEALQ